MIRKYKNIDLIVQVAKKMINENIEFTIIGKALDKHYLSKLNKESESLSNINIYSEEVQDSRVSEILISHDILILPYDINSSLNSGTAILAFSYGKTIICPNIAAVAEYSDKLVYKYTYKNSCEHFDCLLNSTKKAYYDWKNNNEMFVNKGKKLFEIVRKDNSTAKITRQYQNLFDKLSGRTHAF